MPELKSQGSLHRQLDWLPESLENDYYGPGSDRLIFSCKLNK